MNGFASDQRAGMSGTILIWAELIVLGAFFTLDYLGIIQVPISSTLPLFLFAWLSLRLRGMRWRDVGWRRPSAFGKTLLIALLVAGVMRFISVTVVVPLTTTMTGTAPDFSLVAPLRGDLALLLGGLVVAWILAAFGEEFVYRGYLLNRVADLVGNQTLGLLIALLLSSAAFGFVHHYQGAVGMIDTFIAALVAGGLYLADGRRLWLPVLYHGFYDTIGLLLAFGGFF